MTVAVCIKCGEQKVGAIVRCGKCRFLPEATEDLARSLMLCDQSCDKATLLAASENLKAGRPLDYDAAALAQWTETLRQNPQALRMPLGCAILWYAPLAIMLILFAVLCAVIAYISLAIR